VWLPWGNVNLLLSCGIFSKHCSAIVLKFPLNEVNSARTTVPLATKRWMQLAHGGSGGGCSLLASVSALP